MTLTDVKWVFFDLGDTLVDNTKVWLGMMEDMRIALAGLGLVHSLEALTASFEQVSADYAAHPFVELQCRLGLDEMQRQYVKQRCKWRHDLEKPIPGAHDLLAAIQGRYKLAIIANQAPGTADRCRQFGIDCYFDHILGSAELGVSKPDPRIFHMALEKAACPPGNAVMVGDRLDNDIRPAKLLGMKTIRMVYGYQRFQQPRDQWDTPDFTAHSPEEVRKLLLG